MEEGSKKREVKVERESELRCEVGPDSALRLRLINGSAELFGSELPTYLWFTFPPRFKFAVTEQKTLFLSWLEMYLKRKEIHFFFSSLKTAAQDFPNTVFTWYGATVEMDGDTETEYTADETPMVSYVNVHAILEARRNRAKASDTESDSSQGPRVIVVGPTDSGKSSLSRMLLSWAAKEGWKPTYVDLDIGQGTITIPGCIAATPIELPFEPVEGIPLEMPLVYFYGQTHPGEFASIANPSLYQKSWLFVNADLYKICVKELAQILERQFSGNVETRAAGMVINTMGWIDGVGYELLLHAISMFNADVVLVLGQEKLYSMLKGVLKSKPNVDVVKLQKSGGVVSRNQKLRTKDQSSKIREYFYGPGNDLSPHSNIVNFSDLAIYKIGGGPQAPRSALPIGAEPAADPTRLIPVNISADLIHSILAVSFAKEIDQILTSNVAGFIYITEVDIQRNQITYLAPCPGELPSRFLIMGNLTWLET